MRLGSAWLLSGRVEGHGRACTRASILPGTWQDVGPACPGSEMGRGLEDTGPCLHGAPSQGGRPAESVSAAVGEHARRAAGPRGRTCISAASPRGGAQTSAARKSGSGLSLTRSRVHSHPLAQGLFPKELISPGREEKASRQREGGLPGLTSCPLVFSVTETRE